MAKIHKVEMYIIDYNNECESSTDISEDIGHIFDHCDLSVGQIESKTVEYDLDDESEDYEKYFK